MQQLGSTEYWQSPEIKYDILSNRRFDASPFCGGFLMRKNGELKGQKYHLLWIILSISRRMFDKSKKLAFVTRSGNIWNIIVVSVLD